MKDKKFTLLTSILCLVSILPSWVEAGSLQKKYVNLSKEGNQATTTDIPTGYNQIESTLKTIGYNSKGNHGVISGATLTQDGIIFDGNDYMSVNSNAFLLGQNAFTIETQFKTTDPSGSLQELLFANGSSHYLFIEYTPSTGNWNMGWNGSTGNYLNFTKKITNSDWHHVAMVRTNSTTIEAYIDGELVGTKNTLPIGNAGGSYFYFGMLSGNSRYFKGEMKEFRIWNYAKNQTDIQSTMNKSLTKLENGLVGYWSFIQ